MKRLKTLALVFVLILSMTGCAFFGSQMDADSDLMKDVIPQEIGGELAALDGENAVGPTDFAVRLFQSSLSEEENTVISPVSVLYALAMTANGARGETLLQMETVLDMPISELNGYLKAYMDALPEGEKYKMSIANSIWFTDDEGFTVVPEFLQTNANYYDAGIYQVPFDHTACKNINAWVADNTDKMIKNIIDKIPPEAVMYLINAVAFDAEWQNIYEDTQVRKGVFTTESGEKQDIEMMRSMEGLYLEDENAIGFIKPYADHKYTFAVLLPDEDVSVREYVNALTGERLASILANAQDAVVSAAMPKFESEYRAEMREILSSMGMTDAFDTKLADFSGLGISENGNIFIENVIHESVISVNEKGTKAGAVTAVMASGGSAPGKIKEVVLDRPFVYMIIDCEANLPLFMGVQMNMN